MKRAKKFLSILLSMTLILTLFSVGNFTVYAKTTSGTTGDCTWSLDGTVLTISGNGPMESNGMETGPWGNSITKVIIEEGVTSICASAFYDCTNLTEVSISNTVETIESEAFHWCSNLEEVVLPEGLKRIGTNAFVQCHKLKSVSIPASVTTMGRNPFQWCSSLTSINVAEGNTHFFSEGNCLIERSTGILISGCENSVIPENAGIKEIGYDAFSSIEGIEEVIIPYGVERINRYAFWSCENLVKVEIPETVEYIDPDALRFLNPQAIVSISEDNKTYHSSGNCIIETDSKTIIVGYSNSTIPADDSVTIIGDNAFYGSMALIDLYIPDNITAIGDNAFGECRNLVNIHIGKGITDISNRAFCYCRSLETISVDPDNPRYCAVGNCLIDTQTKILLKGTKKSVIPVDGSVSTIGEYAFYVIDIPSIKLPEGVMEIKEFAFSGIAEIELPNSLRTVHANAFGACDELERVLYNGTIDERDRIQFLDDGCGNENLLSAQWQYGEEWADSGIEFFVKDLQVMEKRDSYSPGDDDLYYERYSINPEFEIRFNDGTIFKSEDYAEAFWELEEKTGRSIHFYDNQSFAKQWGVGEHTVTAYFMGETTEFTVTVVENPIKSIEVDPVVCIENYNGYWDGHYDDNGDYVSNSWFCYNDAPQNVTVEFKDGSNISGMWSDVEDQITTQYGGYGTYWSNQGYNNSWSVGEHKGYLQLLGITAEYTVEVMAKSLSSIAVTTLPTKLVYLEGESFDDTGMIVTAYYNDNTEAIMTDFTIFGFSQNVGKKTVTVSCGGQTDSFEVAVICRNHIYINACDASCDVCDWIRKPQAHIFTNNCDTVCNECGSTRIVGDHIYTNDHDTKCNECGDIREVPACVFTNDCDSKCNICGDIRAIAHNYGAATCTKAKVCKVCGVTSGKALGHTYTNNCDTTCNYCSAKRTIKHTYSNNCDTSCNVCKATRTITHAYKTTTTKATLSKNGSAAKKCTVCGKVASNTAIKYAKTFKLSTTTYTYNGKVKTPSVTVKDSAGKTLKKNTDYTVTYASGRKNVGTYKVTIKMKGKYSGTKTLTFKINPAKTTVSKLTAGKKSITVAITKKSTQVTGYQIQYSTSKKFTNAKTKTISSYKTTKYNLKSLSAKKTYYVRVRTYKTVGKTKYYSGWSTYKYVKTK